VTQVQRATILSETKQLTETLKMPSPLDNLIMTLVGRQIFSLRRYHKDSQPERGQFELSSTPQPNQNRIKSNSAVHAHKRYSGESLNITTPATVVRKEASLTRDEWRTFLVTSLLFIYSLSTETCQNISRQTIDRYLDQLEDQLGRQLSPTQLDTLAHQVIAVWDENGKTTLKYNVVVWRVKTRLEKIRGVDTGEFLVTSAVG
jgi:hypothetical protein